MTRLLDPETSEDGRMSPRPLITIGIPAAGLSTLFVLALKFGWFAAVGAIAPLPSSTPPHRELTLDDVGRSLEAHQQQMLKMNEEQQRSSDRQERLLERLCIVASVSAGARPEECAR